jgi:hypothetical protein
VQRAIFLRAKLDALEFLGVEAFSDGVLAVVIKLLVLEIKLPSGLLWLKLSRRIKVVAVGCSNARHR